MRIDHQHYFEALQDMFNDMLNLDIGTAQQKANALYSLFETYQTEFLTFWIFGYKKAIKDALTADVTHTWLDTVVGAQSIRQHLIDRVEGV